MVVLVFLCVCVFVVGYDMCSGHGELQARLIENVLKVGERERVSTSTTRKGRGAGQWVVGFLAIIDAMRIS